MTAGLQRDEQIISAGGFPGLLATWGGWNKGPEGDNPHDPWDRGRLYDGRPKVLWAHWVPVDER